MQRPTINAPTLIVDSEDSDRFSRLSRGRSPPPPRSNSLLQLVENLLKTTSVPAAVFGAVVFFLALALCYDLFAYPSGFSHTELGVSEIGTAHAASTFSALLPSGKSSATTMSGVHGERGLFRDDMRCTVKGALRRVKRKGSFSMCDPHSANPCCSMHGFCGSTERHCMCVRCVDYSEHVASTDPDAIVDAVLAGPASSKTKNE